MFTANGMELSTGFVWCFIGILLIIIAHKIKSRKRLHLMVYGLSLAGFLMGASCLFDNTGISYVGTNLIFICVILILIDVMSKKP